MTVCDWFCHCIRCVWLSHLTNAIPGIAGSKIWPHSLRDSAAALGRGSALVIGVIQPHRWYRCVLAQLQWFIHSSLGNTYSRFIWERRSLCVFCWRDVTHTCSAEVAERWRRLIEMIWCAPRLCHASLLPRLTPRYSRCYDSLTGCGCRHNL